MIFIRFLDKTSEAFKNFKIYKEMVETETDLKIKCLRLYNGGEFTSKEFTYFFGEQGIKRQSSIARKLQQNGDTKIMNRTIYEMARTMLKDSKLGDVFWVHAFHTRIHI